MREKIELEYQRWLRQADISLRAELKSMTAAEIEDAFYQDLAFGTGGLRGVLGAGTNRMNIHTVAKSITRIGELFVRKL